MNLLKGKVEKRDGRSIVVEAGGKDALTIPLNSRLAPLANRYVDKEIVFGIRPEHVTKDPKDGCSVPVTLTVDIAEPMGSESLVYLKTATSSLIARIQGEHLFDPGEELTVQLDLEKVSLFDIESEKVIR